MTDDMFDDAPPAARKNNQELFDSGPKITEGNSSRTMPHPVTGKQVLFQRASRFAGSIADQHMISRWGKALTVIGLSRQKNLYAKAASLRLPDEDMEFRARGWWTPWEDIADDAMIAAGSKHGADLGTAVHEWAFNVEMGFMTMKDVLSEWRPHVEALLRLHTAHGMITEPNYLERIVVNLSAIVPKSTRKNSYQGICGRYDGLRRMPDGTLIVDDTKTGKNAPLGLDEIAIQLAVYANSEYVWNPDTESYDLMPAELRKDMATMTWIPIHKPEDAEVIPIDIKAGWEQGARIAREAREWRAKAKLAYGGIRLPVEALQGAQATLETPETYRQDYSSRLGACTTLAQVSAVFMEANSIGAWTPALAAHGKMAQNRIRLGITVESGSEISEEEISVES